MRERLKYLLIMFLMLLAVFVTQKPLFMLYNLDVATNVGIGDYFMVMFHGLQLDITVTSYCMVLPTIVVLLSFFKKVPVRKILVAYYFILMLIIATIFVADAVLYHFWGFKLNSSVFMYTDRPGDALASVSFWFVIFRVLLIFVFAKLYSWLCYKLTPKFFVRNPKYRISAMILIPVLGLYFLGIRGGIDESTANVSDVYYSDNQFLNHAAVNPTFNMLYTLTKSKDFSKEFNFYGDEERETLTKGLFTTESVDTDTLLRTRRPNVLIVIWEGCPGAFVEAVGGEPDVTPNLNRLANEGVVFTNCYANSYRTDRGVLCTLSGWLGMPTASLMKMTDKSSNLPAIAESLGAFGYKCDFWYGGDVGFTNMNSYLYESGYKTVRGDMYFSAEDRNYSKWGVPDHVVLDSVANNIINRKDIDGRWMTTVLTLSSHEPWEVPYQRLDEKKRNSMAYTDDCMGKFVERLKQSPVWNDLLVVVLSDHGIKSNQKQQNSDYEVAHIPMVWIGGAVKEHRVVSSIMAQSDMAATLLGQLDIPHDDFIFSRDVMSKTYQCPSAFHTFDNGMTLIDSLGVVTYDNNAKRTIYSELFTGGQMDIKLYENKIKAVLQTVYKDAATR
jgi:phosphoglycerol transferase MdoB-like AlkP superfamily enzyme